MKKILFYLLTFTYCLLQTLIGGFVFLFNYGCFNLIKFTP